MARSPKVLIVTTGEDLSLKLFYDPKNTKLLEPVRLGYMAPDEELASVFHIAFDYVYFRDPFNDEKVEQDYARATTSKVLKHYDSAYKVDGIADYTDMLFEDKWHQYQLFPKHMPHTELLESRDFPDGDRRLTKKRISARSRDIIFAKESFPGNAKPQDYITQPMLKIEKEYRIYMIGGEIVKPIAVKTSKTPGVVVKLIGLEDTVSSEILKICKSVSSVTKFDLIGIDIAKTASGFLLLEVNRSCQFNSYFKLANINLAVLLSRYLIEVKG